MPVPWCWLCEAGTSVRTKLGSLPRENRGRGIGNQLWQVLVSLHHMGCFKCFDVQSFAGGIAKFRWRRSWTKTGGGFIFFKEGLGLGWPGACEGMEGIWCLFCAVNFRASVAVFCLKSQLKSMGLTWKHHELASHAQQMRTIHQRCTGTNWLQNSQLESSVLLVIKQGQPSERGKQHLRQTFKGQTCLERDSCYLADGCWNHRSWQGLVAASVV